MARTKEVPRRSVATKTPSAAARARLTLGAKRQSKQPQSRRSDDTHKKKRRFRPEVSSRRKQRKLLKAENLHCLSRYAPTLRDVRRILQDENFTDIVQISEAAVLELMRAKEEIQHELYSDCHSTMAIAEKQTLTMDMLMKSWMKWKAERLHTFQPSKRVAKKFPLDGLDKIAIETEANDDTKAA